MLKLREPVYSQGPALASGIPLGGLGTGSVELRDDGRFHDWEIFNNYAWSGAASQAAPDMWSEDAFFAVRVCEPDGSPRVRLLYRDGMESRAASGYYHHAIMYNFPFLRNVARITYSGQHPFAHLVYEDDGLPIELTLEAFTPFIPFNARDSALPLAAFAFRVRNLAASSCDVSLMFSMRNCAGYDLEEAMLHHQIVEDDGSTVMAMAAEGLDPGLRTNGSMAIGVLGGGASWLPGWTDGHGLEGFEIVNAPALCQLLYPFRDHGVLTGAEREWRRRAIRRPVEHRCGDLHYLKRRSGWRWRGALCRKLSLAPGQEEEVVFGFAWFFPNHYHYFAQTLNLGHMYGNWFGSAAEVLAYGLGAFDRLRTETRCFRDHLYGGSVPEWLAASLSAQLTTFPQSFWWTRDGDMAVWEGSACCQIIPGARTIWSSWQPLLFFPDVYMGMIRRLASPDEAAASRLLQVERERRQGIRRDQQQELGGWIERRFRRPGSGQHGASRRAQGRRAATTAVELARDYQWTGDDGYRAALWPGVKAALEARMEADEDGDGLPDGAISFITYDHWFLPAVNCYLCSLWLAELRAGVHLAELAGDGQAQVSFAEVLQKGMAAFEGLLWNGEYYSLCIDADTRTADPGCLADQVSGHLYLRLCGLEPVHDVERARSALGAVFRYNRRPEEGLLNGADPRGRDDWRYFARFSARGEDEALGGQWVTPWTGTEYYVSAVMVAEGLVAEGLAVAKDVYDRHAAAGMLYNHIECGEHYFRPMAAWAILPALLGLRYDAGRGRLAFGPKITPEEFDGMFILPGVYGRLKQQRTAGGQANAVQIVSGELTLQTIEVDLAQGRASAAVPAAAQFDGRQLECASEPAGQGVAVTLGEALVLKPGQELRVHLGATGVGHGSP
jgi:uncharacterized protein (DUF608 family)